MCISFVINKMHPVEWVSAPYVIITEADFIAAILEIIIIIIIIIMKGTKENTHIAHILRKVLMQNYKRFNIRNSVIFTVNSNYRIAETL